ncbi:helix-turn-helix domain-containing protein [Streptomyces desertarenae]|uniref:Helix-turn-helix domain-containing protein n=1 Tax=Streptomyces desertarenae TaxID=2666184 RepID=A0ABW4PSM7_9ACTN
MPPTGVPAASPAPAGPGAAADRAGTERAGGSVVVTNPEVPHAARAGAPGGWAHATFYPASDTVAAIAAGTTALRGTAGFSEAVVHAPYAARLITGVYRAAEQGDAPAADILLRVAATRLLRRHGGPLPARTVRTAGARNAARAREILLERMTDPPMMERFAAELGTGPFPLLRAFRERYGMPPHAWLTDARVRRARRLPEEGMAPAGAAAAVGFADQPHPGRHFSRIVGVPQGAYQRERARTYKTGRGRPV